LARVVLWGTAPIAQNRDLSFLLREGVQMKEDKMLSKVLESPVPVEYYNTSLKKVVLLSIFSFSIYDIYWMYRNWKTIKKSSGLDMSPFWRAAFVVFFCYHLFKIMKLSIEQKSVKINHLAGSLATIYILANTCGRISGRYNHWSANILFFVSFISITPLFILQKAVNVYNKSIDQSYVINTKFTKGSIITFVLGGLLWTVFLLGMILPA
jgi:hypothetical protein